ncbi:hypothetical protein Hanom_Chr11g01033061 [Helianthus anomalus]
MLFVIISLRYVMLCYVMLCYVMLCYVMLCYVMLCYVMLCYVMLCYVMKHFMNTEFFLFFFFYDLWGVWCCVFKIYYVFSKLRFEKTCRYMLLQNCVLEADNQFFIQTIF